MEEVVCSELNNSRTLQKPNGGLGDGVAAGGGTIHAWERNVS